jgi:phthalate 4,5-cis-dihydrodiol dehydrogenase
MKPRDKAPGHYTALLEFENGAYATLVYGAYGYFLASEFFDPNAGGPDTPGLQSRITARREITTGIRDEAAAKEEVAARGSPGQRSSYLSDLGLLLVSGERGEIRQSPRGLYIYREDGTEEVPLNAREQVGVPELVELQNALFNDKPALHDGAWGMATLEVCLGIMQSSLEHREIAMRHQVPVADSF